MTKKKGDRDALGRKKPNRPEGWFQRRNIGRAVMRDLLRHPESTAAEICRRTGLTRQSVDWELNRYKNGNHDDPRYELTGYELRAFADNPNPRPAAVWRLAVEPELSARRRLKKAVARVGLILTAQPQLAGEAVQLVMTEVKKAKEKAKGKRRGEPR